MNVDQLRKQAKELLKAARAGDEDALARLGGREPILARAQLVLARENGYASWPRLLAAAEANAEEFVLAATDRRRDRAEQMLEARPEIERDAWARLVLGREWSGDPNAEGGPRGWTPLLYVCHSAFMPQRLARELLERGADPNHRVPAGTGHELTALYGAAGIAHDPDITRLLLEAGANPNDGESLYHAIEAESTECLRLLLEHRAETRGTNALLHALDFDRIEYLRLLLEFGADADEGALIAGAARRIRGPEFMRLLAAHGANLDRPGGQARPGDPLHTGYQLATLRGCVETAETLAELGASTALAPNDAAVAAFARGQLPASALPSSLDPDQREVVLLAALNGRLEEVVEAFGPEFRAFYDGSPEATLLHFAAWFGNVDAVRGLLARGADPNAACETDLATPAGWAAFASRRRLGGDEYVAVMELLREAGAELEPRLATVAFGPLADWFRGESA